MPVRGCSLLSLLFLVGCPTPPSDVVPADPSVQPPPAAPPGGVPGPATPGAVEGTAPPTDAAAPPTDAAAGAAPVGGEAPPPVDPGAAAPATGGEGGGGGGALAALDLGINVPQMTQDAIKAAAHVTLSGTLAGTCAGTVQLIVIDNSPLPEGATPKPGPVAVLDGVSVGAFTVAIPKGIVPRVGAFCDGNKDKIVDPAQKADKAAQQVELPKATADTSNVDLAFPD